MRDCVFTVLLLWHDGVAQGEQAEELLDVGVLAHAHLVHQRLVEELERGLVLRVPREVHATTRLKHSNN